MFNRLSRRHKFKLNNSGSTLMIVMVAVALISVLATVLMAMSYMNYNMKVTEMNSKKNFYTAEVVLDQINVGLQKEISDSLEDAYVRSMQRYTLENDVTRNTNFANYYIGELTSRLRTASLDSQYQIAPIDTDGDGVYDCGLVHYLDTALQQAYFNGDLIIDSLDPKMQSVAVSKTNDAGDIEYESQGLVLYNLYISYTDANEFTTVIETDIRLKTPTLTLVTKTAMPNVFDYCMVADAGITGGTTGVVATINGSVYAGNDTGNPADLGGISCAPSHNWTFEGDSKVVSAGPLSVAHNATLTTTDDINGWYESIRLTKYPGVSSGTLNLSGDSYVKDDLTIEGSGATVKLKGNYYGFGYGSTAKESSAIILNGKNAVLDMTGLERLMLGGNAYIQTSQVTYNVDDAAGFTADNNTDILTGNTLAVKSDQIAYLVPAECVGVNGNVVEIGKNPMTAEEYKEWKSYEKKRTDGDANYANYQLVSLTKDTAILGKSLGEYQLNTSSGPGYKTVFRTVNGDTLCYLYLDLTQNGAAEYYKDFYYAAETKMNRYITTYNNRILMNLSAMNSRVSRGTILTYALDTASGSGDISLVENTINEATSSDVIASIEEDYYVSAGRYARMKAKLTLEESDVTDTELVNTVYTNLINESVMNALPNNTTGEPHTFDFTTIGLTTKAVFVNNRGLDPFTYGDQPGDEDICVIVATGDVSLQKDFDGLLITDGKIILENGVTYVMPNKELVLRTLRQPASAEADAMSLIAKYFKNGANYSMDTRLSGEVENSMTGQQSMGELIVYENWAKQ